MSPFYVKPFVRRLKDQDSVEDIKAGNIEAICVASYSAVNKSRLAYATEANMSMAIAFQHTLPGRPPIIFGSCSHAFPDSWKAEEELKMQMCLDARASFLSVCSINNSITEMEAWYQALFQRGLYPRSVLIVTGELHSGAERLLSKIVMPECRTFISCTPHWLEVQTDHPTDDQASWPRWLSCSIQRYGAFKLAASLPSKQQEAFIDCLRKKQHKFGKIKTVA